MYKNLRPDRRGVSAIVTFVLLTSVALIFLGNWLMVAVPKWGSEDELKHTRQVENQFVGIRASSKALIYADNTQFVLPNSLTLGTSGAAFKGVARANGNLVFDPLARSSIILNNSVPSTLAATKGNLVFSSQNQYYPDQSLVFECGATLRYQDGNSVMIAPPDFISEIEGSEVTLKMVFISLTGETSKSSGNIDVVVYTRLHTREYNWYNWTDTPEDISMVIKTDYPNAWATYFQTHLRKTGFTQVVAAANDGEFSIISTSSSCTVTVANVDFFETTVAAVDISFG